VKSNQQEYRFARFCSRVPFSSRLTNSLDCKADPPALHEADQTEEREAENVENSQRLLKTLATTKRRIVRVLQRFGILFRLNDD